MVGYEEVFRSNCRSLREGYARLWSLENTDLRRVEGTTATIRHHAAGTLDVNVNQAENFLSSALAPRSDGERIFLTDEWTALMK